MVYLVSMIRNDKIPLFGHYVNPVKRPCVYSLIKDSEVELFFERNNAGLKGLLCFVNRQVLS